MQSNVITLHIIAIAIFFNLFWSTQSTCPETSKTRVRKSNASTISETYSDIKNGEWNYSGKVVAIGSLAHGFASPELVYQFA